MAIDPYSTCPGGSGKKIKFCCPDLLDDLNKLQRMLEGDQHAACLRQVEHLETKHPDRACLQSIKTMLLRLTGQIDAWRQATERFIQTHPRSSVALGEVAMLAAISEGGKAGVGPIQQAISLSGGSISFRCFEAVFSVAQALLADGFVPAARAHFVLLAQINSEDREPLEVLVRINRTGSLPLLLRDERRFCDHVDEGKPWKKTFDESMHCVQRALWAEAVEKLESIVGQYPEAPEAWCNLATFRLWLADHEGAVEALRRFAALDVPYDDAVEAEALALHLVDDPLGDEGNLCNLIYPVEDADQLNAALSLVRRAVRPPVDPRSLAEGDDPPPKGVFILLDRAPPSESPVDSHEEVPEVVGTALLFGRQTDRPARLEVRQVTQRDVPRVKDVLAELTGAGLGSEPSVESADGKVSWSQDLLTARLWLPPTTSAAEGRRLTRQRRLVQFGERWPERPLPVFGDKTPSEAASVPGLRVRLAGVLMFLEDSSRAASETVDLDPIREKLGLPVPEPVDPTETPICALPSIRLDRVEVSRVSDEDLIFAMHRALAFDIRAATHRFAAEVVARPSLQGREEWLVACQNAARTEWDTDRALEYVERGRTTSVDRGLSSAPWDLLELSLRFARGEADEASRVLRHIESEHLHEPNVGEALAGMLMQLGLLRPDGSPAIPPEAAAETGAPGGPVEPAAGNLWTPESQPSGAEKKLWMPGME